jgi:fibronectin type III domain protein
MTHQTGHTLKGHRTKAWSVAISAALILTGFAGVAPAEALASETPIPTWGTGPMPPSSPQGDDWQGGRVYAITRANGRIYLGGAFTQAVGPDGSTPEARPGLIAINAATGQLDRAFDAHVNGQVWALAPSPDGTTIYVGGAFTNVGGVGSKNLAAINSTTGLAVPGWKADADQAVQGIAVSGSRVYAGGKFDTITDVSGAKTRSHLVAVNAADGSVVTGWSASVTGGDVDCGRGGVTGPPYVRAITLSADGTRVLVGGCFLGLNGVFRQHMGALNPTTGALDTTFRPMGGREVFAIASDSARVYAAQGGGGGEGTAFNPASGQIIWSVHGDGNFQGLAVMGGLVYFGGHFGGDNLFFDAFHRASDRNKLAAVNAVTGAIHPFAAHTNSPLGIFVVRNSGNFLDVGGDFTLAGPETNMEKVAHFAQFPVPTSPPGTPTSLQAVASDGAVNLSWTAPEDGGSPITEYRVTPRIGGVAGTERVFLDDATTQTITGLTNGAAYTFIVVARNATGFGPASAASAAVTPAGLPGAPGAVSAVPGNGAATVSWSAPSNNGGSAVTGYVVTPAVNGTPGTSRQFTSTATTQTITGLANGTAYTFTVAAQNAKGTGPAGAASAAVTPASAPVTPASVNTQVLGVVQSSGYWLLGEAGTVYPFGAAKLFGAPAAGSLSGAADDMQETTSGNGYWIVDTAGQVQAFGDARWLGNADRKVMAAGEQVTSLAATPSGQGYWLFTSRGRVFARGDARHLGDVSAVPLNGPVLDSIATPSGNGYYMVASDGGIFAFGDAAFAGSMGARRLNSPVRSAVPDPDGAGYWLVAGDGGVFAFAAPFRGSTGALRLNSPIVGMVSFGNGYLLVGADGGVFNYSDRAFSGSLGSSPPARPIVSVAALS